jgi:hypothetical protein
MIEQFLNRDYMLAIAAAVVNGVAREAEAREYGAAAARRGHAADPLADVTTRELREFAEALRQAPELKPVLRRRDSTRHPRARSGETELKKEDSVYIPRDRMLSIVQSAVEESVERHQPDAVEEPPARIPDGRRARHTVPTITHRRLKDASLQVTPGRRVWRPFEVATGGWVWLSDPRWAFSLAHKLWRDATDNLAVFVARPQTITIENDARVFLVGDWGSGLDRAARVAEQIKKEMARSGRRQNVIIHLGDVYYSGTEREFKRRFLGPWPVDSPTTSLSLTLPGNHDMYSGGHGYFEHALTDSRFVRQGGCSYFSLQNDHWRLLGLDSAYEDGGLNGEQAAWARATIMESPDNVGTVLLSHHQPFSAHNTGNRTLRRKIAPVLATKRVDAWFWGHEHRCIVYGPADVDGNPLAFSSCLGHGGVPEYLIMREGDTKPPPWAYEYLRVDSDDFQPWGTFGFAVMELNNERISIRYIDEHGVNHHTVDDVPRIDRDGVRERAGGERTL